MTFKAIETQEELDRIIQERLNREKGKFADYDEIKTRNAALETEVDALKSTIEETSNAAKTHEQTIADLNKQITEKETVNLRTRIALQNGLPIDLADRLIGSDEESIKADAERLAGFVSKKQTPPPLKKTEPIVEKDEDADLKEMLKKLNDRGE
ncbi:capsid assembly scaffolding protein Gp46 family protein [Enterococcus sp. DIV1059_2]|uniref:capsid assembly scaffolding protein Gp46 family protein n=1 Tax=Enterococcus sp. DIV1059_2 TaxID=2774664 RepID=UPI003F2194F1